ncbi:MAG TPA: DUF2182 domain-containing protein [Casimicrobiaceae bacterium]|nr:DUF2182 domain-containing protein [Casimicrobiaceae bacterium]
MEPRSARGLEAVLRRDRAITLVALATVVGLAWRYLWQVAASIDDSGMGMGMGTAAAAAAAGGGSTTGWPLSFAMWVIMMAGMMLPSAAPAILAYGSLVRRNGERGGDLPTNAWCFALGYIVVWVVFSAAAALLQRVLEQQALLTPMLASASTRLGALALIAAGVWQLTPVKRACLARCRSPLTFFVTRWRPGIAGALRMGIEHGASCVGCCWALMMLLFVAGVMNLMWVAAIAAFVFIEKIAPAGDLTSRVAAAALILYGAYALAV